MNLQKVKHLILPLSIFWVTFLIYIHNLSASVYGGDSGDFLSTIAVRGVAHPSGYPLYTILGILASWLPLNLTLAWKVGLLSALFSSLAVTVMYFVVNELLKNRFLALWSSLTLAFVFPFWLFAEVSEVFALNSLFLLLLLYLCVLSYTRKRVGYLYLLSLCLGLSFANHELTILMIPSIVVLVFAMRKNIDNPISVISKCLLFFVLGLLPYAYIPLAASHNPAINWIGTPTIDNFMQFVTRARYGWGSGEINTGLRFIALQKYVGYLLSNLSLFTIAFALFGMFQVLFQKRYALLAGILLGFIAFGPAFVFYEGHINLEAFDFGIIEKFFTASFIFMIVLAPYGIAYIIDFLSRFVSSFTKSKSAVSFVEKIVFGMVMLIPVTLFLTNISNTDLHTVSIGNRFGKDILSALPKNSYVYVSNNDNVVFTSRYMQYAYGIRQDVIMSLTPQVSGKINDTSSRQMMATSKAKNCENKRPWLTNVKDYNDQDKEEKTTLMPFGLLFLRKSKKEENLSRDDYLKMQQPILNSFEEATRAMPSADTLSHLKLISDLPQWYARAYTNTGFYLIDQYQDYETANKYFIKAAGIDPNSSAAYEGIGDYAMHRHNCQDAKTAYEESTNIDFLNKRIYQKLYNVVDLCLHDESGAKQLRDFFTQYKYIFSGMSISQ